MPPVLLLAVLLAQQAPADVSAPSASAPSASAPSVPAPNNNRSHTAFFPLPMYTTVPNEGSTYGFMPVFLRVDSTGEIRHIWAPSVSWNKAAGVNGTLRYYRYPDREQAWSVIAAASTHVNRTLWLTYDRFPLEPGRLTLELFGLARRNLFYRFFGLGPDSLKENESSYTRTTGMLTSRTGVNVPGHFNIGVRFTIRDDQPKEHAIFGLPTLEQAHPGTPGINGGAMALAGLSLRYDTRRDLDYSDQGIAVEVAGNRAFGLRGFDHFWQVWSQARALWMETSWLQGAARLLVTQELGGHDIPFFYQSSLGGEQLLRGFPEDRFIDRGAWLIETEQRFRVLRTHLFHVITDWRIDPFVGVGQVYGRLEDIGSHLRPTAGIGLRAWVHPNILGRVDVAYAGEGPRAYVVLRYPY
jgi:hypothetical protein